MESLKYSRWYAVQYGAWWAFTPEQFRAMLAHGAQIDGVNLDQFGKQIARRPRVWYLGNIVKVLDWPQEAFVEALADFDREGRVWNTYSPKPGE
jgi:hypothetical protein